MRRFDDEDLTGAEFRECDLSRVRMVGVVMQDAEIDGLVTNLVVNGVDVVPYVEAELDRRHPVRVLIRSDEPDDLPPVMPPAKVLEAVRDALGRHGSENVLAWADDMESDEQDSYRSWARAIILRHWPDLSA